MHFSSIKNTLIDFKNLLIQLSDEHYTMPISNLSNASIGQHSRHIIELFQCLLASYEEGILNYDARERNRQIETESSYAIKALDEIVQKYQKENKDLIINQAIDCGFVSVKTNYHRELLYNLEHCIHHQALIKVALFQLENITVHENFGIAPSTIEYNKQCVQ
jgi:hypothetical protein